MLDARPARGLPRLLARRRPALRDGPRDRLLGRALDPVRRREPRGADLGRAVPRAARASGRACTSRTCCSSRSRSRRCSRLHLLLVASRHHTQFRGAAADRAHGRRHADVPGLRAALARAAVRGRRRCSFLLGGLVQINPIWLWGPYHVADGDERRAARLVPRLADRRAAAHARLGPRDRRLHGRPEPVLGRRALPAGRLRVPLPRGRGSSGGSPATAASTTCSTGRATRPGGRRSASRS